LPIGETVAFPAEQRLCYGSAAERMGESVTG